MMGFSPIPANVFANFTSAMRKPFMQAIGFVSPGDNIINAIWSIPTGGTLVPTTLIGLINGTNRVFICPSTVINGILVFLNGVYQDPELPAYTILGQVITFASAPQVGDTIQALVSAVGFIPTGTGSTPTVLIGTINGTNTVFQCPTPIVHGVTIYLNGVYQDPLVPAYTVLGQTITFTSAPQVGDTIQALVS